MYKLLKDKNNEFQCEIRLEGASAASAKARLFLEADGCEYVFNGQISGETCTIPMGKLKKFANLLESGKIRLEVVADDTLFVPYESDYQLEAEKRVTVEVKQQPVTEKKPMVEVAVKQPVTPKKVDPREVEVKAGLLEIKKYLQSSTKFDGSLKSFQTVIKNEQHKVRFKALCEVFKLDKKVVLEEIIK